EPIVWVQDVDGGRAYVGADRSGSARGRTPAPLPGGLAAHRRPFLRRPAPVVPAVRVPGIRLPGPAAARYRTDAASRGCLRAGRAARGAADHRPGLRRGPELAKGRTR